MKTFVILCALVAMVAANDVYHGNGQPLCNAQELAQGDWRNTWDPTRFWRCQSLNVAAVAVTCHEAQGQWGWLFQESLGRCIPAGDWVWTPQTAPPSRQ